MKRTNFGPSQKEKPNLLAQASLTMPNFGSVRFDGRRYCVRARRSRMTPSIVRQDFLPGCRFSVATTVSAAKGKPKKQASLQENGTGRWPPFPLTLPGQSITRRKSAEIPWTPRHCWLREPRHYGASLGSDAGLAYHVLRHDRSRHAQTGTAPSRRRGRSAADRGFVGQLASRGCGNRRKGFN